MRISVSEVVSRELHAFKNLNDMALRMLEQSDAHLYLINHAICSSANGVTVLSPALTPTRFSAE